MKKPNFILTVAAALAVTAFTCPLAKAQLQVAGDGVSVQQTKIGLSKGEYKTFNLASATGVTATTSGTTSGTLSSMNVSMQGLIATVTTTVTGTLDKKTIAKGKIGNKELLQLILNTTDKDALKGQTLVLASEYGGMLSPVGGFYVGAADLKAASTTVKYRNTTDNQLGVDGGGNEIFYTEIKQGKKDPNERQGTGFGVVGININAALSTYSKSLISSVANLAINATTYGSAKETVFQNPTNGVVTNSVKGTYSTKSSIGFSSKLP